jgi:hypothetical protein
MMVMEYHPHHWMVIEMILAITIQKYLIIFYHLQMETIFWSPYNGGDQISVAIQGNDHF